MSQKADSRPATPDSLSRPKPRPPRTPIQQAQIRVRNRRREYLDRHPSYFDSIEHEMADPLLYDSWIRRFKTPAEREADGWTRGYAGALETALLRGEARLARLAAAGAETAEEERSSAPSASSPAKEEESHDGAEKEEEEEEDTGIINVEAGLAPRPTTKEEGLQRWTDFLAERFVRGGDEDFDYAVVDFDEEYDVLEKRDREDAWFDEEEPRWASEDEGEDGRSERGSGAEKERGRERETGIQDF